MTKIMCLFLPVCFFITACLYDDAPTEEEIRSIFDEQVSLSNSCSTDDECVLVYTGCPLGCSVAVNVDYQLSIDNLANDLINDYQSGGQGCDYSCIQQYPVCNIDTCETRDLY